LLRSLLLIRSQLNFWRATANELLINMRIRGKELPTRLLMNTAGWINGVVRRGLSTWVVAYIAYGCGSDAAAPSSSSPTHSVIISDGAASLNQQETWLAESNGGRIVVVWIGQMPTTTTIEYTISDDAGASWGRPLAVPVPAPVSSLCDPIVTVDEAGNFELVALGLGRVTEILAFRLSAGNSTFGTPTVIDSLVVSPEYFDKPQIVKTLSGYLVTYSRLRLDKSGGVGIVARSTDGLAWHRDTLATNAPILIAPCADGESVTATYLNWFAQGLWVTTSGDGGLTWAAPTQIESTASPEQTPPACVRRDNDVWLLHGTHISGVGLYYSADAGGHFEFVGAIHDGAALYGQIGLRKDKTLELAYYVSSPDVAFGLVHSFISAGATAIPKATVIQRGLQLNQSGNRHGQNGYADYIGVVPGGIAYTDNSTGTSHIAFYRAARD